MKLRIHPAAEEEASAAARWYDQKQEGLGLEFLQEVDRTVRAVGLAPERFARLESLPDEDHVRRALVRRWSFRPAHLFYFRRN